MSAELPVEGINTIKIHYDNGLVSDVTLHYDCDGKAYCLGLKDFIRAGVGSQPEIQTALIATVLRAPNLSKWVTKTIDEHLSSPEGQKTIAAFLETDLGKTAIDKAILGHLARKAKSGELPKETIAPEEAVAPTEATVDKGSPVDVDLSQDEDYITVTPSKRARSTPFSNDQVKKPSAEKTPNNFQVASSIQGLRLEYEMLAELLKNKTGVDYLHPNNLGKWFALMNYMNYRFCRTAHAATKQRIRDAFVEMWKSENKQYLREHPLSDELKRALAKPDKYQVGKDFVDEHMSYITEIKAQKRRSIFFPCCFSETS